MTVDKAGLAGDEHDVIASGGSITSDGAESSYTTEPAISLTKTIVPVFLNTTDDIWIAYAQSCERFSDKTNTDSFATVFIVERQS